jgi:hypothetical protein
MFIKKIDRMLEKLYLNSEDKNSRSKFISRMREMIKENEDFINWEIKEDNDIINREKYNGSALIKESTCGDLGCFVRIKHKRIEDVEFFPKCHFGVFGVCYVIKKFIKGRNTDEILKHNNKDLNDFHDMLLPEYKNCFNTAMRAVRLSIMNFFDRYYEKYILKERDRQFLEQDKNQSILNYGLDFPW